MSETIDIKNTLRSVIGLAANLFIYPFILFVNARTIRWTIAWIHFSLFILIALGARYILYRKNPELIKERDQYRKKTNIKGWDKTIMPLAAIISPIFIYFIAGTDKYCNWTNTFPLWSQITGLCIAASGIVLSSWAMIENKFFSVLVRIQKDRGHTVCDSGPYRIVRHPGYAGVFSILLRFLSFSIRSGRLFPRLLL